MCSWEHRGRARRLGGFLNPSLALLELKGRCMSVPRCNCLSAGSGIHGMQGAGEASLTHSLSSVLVQFAFFEKAANVTAHV